MGHKAARHYEAFGFAEMKLLAGQGILSAAADLRQINLDDLQDGFAELVDRAEG